MARWMLVQISDCKYANIRPLCKYQSDLQITGSAVPHIESCHLTQIFFSHAPVKGDNTACLKSKISLDGANIDSSTY